MEQVVEVSLPARGSFGALVRACRHRACLSQEQLAARAELSARTVRNLEAGRVQAPRADTMRLLADVLQLSEPDRASWFEAARDDPPGDSRPGMGRPAGAGCGDLRWRRADHRGRVGTGGAVPGKPPAPRRCGGLEAGRGYPGRGGSSPITGWA